MVLEAPKDFYTPIGAFFVWPFIGPDTEINKGHQTEMRNSPKVEKVQNKSVNQTIKNL